MIVVVFGTYDPFMDRTISLQSNIRLLRYIAHKFVVQTVIGEQRGAGVKVGAKCLWDSDSDQVAQDVFVTVSSAIFSLMTRLIHVVFRTRCTAVWQPTASTTIESDARHEGKLTAIDVACLGLAFLTNLSFALVSTRIYSRFIVLYSHGVVTN